MLTSTWYSSLARFQHTAARRRLDCEISASVIALRFNTQPPEGGCRNLLQCPHSERVSTHSRPKAAALLCAHNTITRKVSTHSRPKAAEAVITIGHEKGDVSTHSRPKAAAKPINQTHKPKDVSTHSRPKAAVIWRQFLVRCRPVSTHSRPKAAESPPSNAPCQMLFQHTAARRRLLCLVGIPTYFVEFQHTAARRRLGRANVLHGCDTRVSTHSRPKAAGPRECIAWL